MKTFHIQSHDEINTKVNHDEYFNASKARNKQGKNLYHEFRYRKEINQKYYSGNRHLLILVIGLPETVASCKQFHTDTENYRNKYEHHLEHPLEGGVES